jgi:hypothetical protein
MFRMEGKLDVDLQRNLVEFLLFGEYFRADEGGTEVDGNAKDQ